MGGERCGERVPSPVDGSGCARRVSRKKLLPLLLRSCLVPPFVRSSTEAVPGPVEVHHARPV